MKPQAFLDCILVPTGLILMVAYHVWLLYRILKHPTKTIIGINIINRRLWVQAMMEDPSKTGTLAVQTLRNKIMASTLLASTAIMLCSLIAVLMNGNALNRQQGMLFYVDKNDYAFSIKFFSILLCFLLAFLLNVQSIRYYCHASILINVPVKKVSAESASAARLMADYVGRAVNRGSWFWSLGLRAFYFSFPLFFWIFGAIPMFLCCVVLVCTLYFLDVAYFEFGGSTIGPKEEEEEELRLENC